MLNKEKISKIIEEYSLFIMVNHGYDLNIDIKNIDKKIYLTFESSRLDDEVLDFIVNAIECKRDEEIEEYGWELMGEGASDDDLDIVGSLIDEFEYEQLENKTIVRMIRYEQN